MKENPNKYFTPAEILSGIDGRWHDPNDRHSDIINRCERHVKYGWLEYNPSKDAYMLGGVKIK